MKHDNLDKHIRKTLKNHETPLDTEALWLSIAPVPAPPLRRKRWLVYIPFLVLFAVIGTGLSIYFIHDTTPTIVSSSDGSTTHSLDVNPEKNERKDKDTNIITKAENNRPTISNEGQTTTNPTAKNQGVSIDGNQANISTPNLGEYTDNQSLNGSSSSQNPSKNMLGNEANNLSPQVEGNTPNIPNSPSNISPLLLPNKEIPVINNTTITKPELETPVLTTPSKPMANDDPNRFKKERIYTLYNEEDLLPIARVDEIEKEKRTVEEIKRRRTRTYRKKQVKPFRAAIGGHIGYGFTTQDLVSKTAETEPYRQARLNSESPLESIELMADMLTEHRLGFTFRTGINYTMINERFTFKKRETITTESWGVTDIFISTQGDSTLVMGNVVTTNTIESISTSYNKYHLIDIPLVLGYKFDNDPWSLSLEGGIYLNALLRAKGEIISPIQSNTKTDLGADNVIKSNILFSTYGAVSVNYQLDDDWRLSMATYLRYSPNSFTQDDYPIEQRHSTIGVRLGVYFMLN